MQYPDVIHGFLALLCLGFCFFTHWIGSLRVQYRQRILDAVARVSEGRANLLKSGGTFYLLPRRRRDSPWGAFLESRELDQLEGLRGDKDHYLWLTRIHLWSGAVFCCLALLDGFIPRTHS